MKSVGGTVGKIKDLDGEWLVVFDRGARTYFADMVVELTVSRGVVRMSFAAISTNGDGIPKATVVARIRMPKDAAKQLYGLLLQQVEG